MHRTGPRSFQCLIPTFAIRHLPSDDPRDETDPILMNKLYETSLVEALRTPTSRLLAGVLLDGQRAEEELHIGVDCLCNLSLYQKSVIS